MNNESELVYQSRRFAERAETGSSLLARANHAMMLETDIQATSKPSIALLSCKSTSNCSCTLHAGVLRDILMSNFRLFERVIQIGFFPICILNRSKLKIFGSCKTAA